MSKRAERRCHKERMRKHAREIFRHIWSNPSEIFAYENERGLKWSNHSEEQVVRFADNICMCSRSCCGNPRKWWKEKTRQETKADNSFADQVND
jgi:5'-deoxynucleotidase YfbR-like HD superfamily hydrolase